MWSNGRRKSLVFEVGVGDRLGTLKVLGIKCKRSQESTVYAGGNGSAGSKCLRGQRVYGESGGLRGCLRAYGIKGLRVRGSTGLRGLRGQGVYEGKGSTGSRGLRGFWNVLGLLGHLSRPGLADRCLGPPRGYGNWDSATSCPIPVTISHLLVFLVVGIGQLVAEIGRAHV